MNVISGEPCRRTVSRPSATSPASAEGGEDRLHSVCPSRLAANLTNSVGQGTAETPTSAPLAAPEQSAESRAVIALVWAKDSKQAVAAVEFLRHRLWPYWFRFQIAEIRELPLGGPCPLRREDSAALASAGGDLWTWVLVASGSEFGAVVSCM